MIKSNHVQYGSPTPGKAVSPRGAGGRLCSHEGCATIVSKYNPEPTCWTHSASTRRLPLDGR
ncbi:MAG TPA: hypothetical protein VNN79_04415 [Actinomycetota bacterium]|jgi:hypothetical protein|nr:hypothetical protein [Actinomycetota bacterium]